MEDIASHFSTTSFLSFIPDELVQIILTFALSFLIGLEREERRADKTKFYIFGGVRTFPIIGLIGYLSARLSAGQPWVIAAGFIIIGLLLLLSYRKKLELSSVAGMNSEVSGLFTFLIGALVYQKAFWGATTLTVIILLLLELKNGLESLARKIPNFEIFTFTRFLLLSAVILPLVPNEDFGPYHLNPHKTWLIVVAISGLSYLAYALGKILRSGSRQILLSSVLGGLYSSTITTVFLAKRSRDDDQPRLYSGAILVASGLMYYRILALLSLFNWELARQIAMPFLILGSIGCIAGFLWSNFRVSHKPMGHQETPNRNPLEIRSAILFALLFIAMSIITRIIELHLGNYGVYGLSFLSGLSDIDPFVMSLSQTAGHPTTLTLAGTAIIIAAASNNLVKGAYAYSLASDNTRKYSAIILTIFSILGFVTLIK